MYCYYAYTFYFGSILVANKVENTSQPGNPAYTSGDIMSCFFGVIFGIFSLSAASPNIKAVVEGRIAGKLAYETINRKP